MLIEVTSLRNKVNNSNSNRQQTTIVCRQQFCY